MMSFSRSILLCLQFCLLTVCTFSSVLTGVTSSSAPTQDEPSYVLHGSGEKVSGVWTITKIVSLTGPTVAIFLYKKLRDQMEKYGPLITAGISEMAREIQSESRTPFAGRGFFWLSSLPEGVEDAFVTRVANEVIRLTNLRLREKAVISRIQMDEDQYEFNRRISGTEVREVALRVLKEVLNHGAGSYLSESQKYAVQDLIRGSVK